MRAALGVGLAHVAILALGLAVPGLPAARGTRLALAYALGLGIVSSILFASALAGLASVACVAVPALVAGAIVLRRGRTSPPEEPGRDTLAARIAWLAIGLEVVTCLALSFATDLGTDGLAVWEIKARAVFVDRALPRTYLEHPSFAWSHREYPWLVPLAEAWLELAAGEARALVAKALFPGVFVALLALFHGALRETRPRETSLALTAILGATPALATQACTGYADVPLALFTFASATTLHRWLRTGERRDAILAAVLAVLAAWTKREGLVFLALEVGTFASAPLWGRRWREAAPGVVAAVASAAVVLGPWTYVLASRGIRGADFGDEPHLERTGEVLGLLAQELARPAHWGLLWILFAASLLTVRRRADAWLAVAVVAPLGTLALSFAWSRWTPWQAHARFSLDRLVVQHAPLALYAVALAFTREEPPARAPATAA